MPILHRKILPAIGMVLLLSALAILAQAKPVAHPQTIEIDPTDRVIGAMFIGGSGTDDATLRTSWGIFDRDQGWPEFIEKIIEPTIEAGFKRIELHNPFGYHSREDYMQFDQYNDALNEFPVLTENFVELWSPIVDQVDEVIAYIGSPDRDPEQIALQDDPIAWWERAERMIKPLVDSGMSIGFDAASPDGPNSFVYKLAKDLKSKGIKVYVEPRPWKQAPQWFDFPVITLNTHWKLTDPDAPEANPTVRARYARNHELTGEIIRMVFKEEEDGNWTPMKKILSEGHTATTYTPNVFWPHKGNMTLPQLLDRLDIPSLPTLIQLTAENMEGDNITFEITQYPRHGRLERVQEDPTRSLYRYHADPFFKGHDSFEFQASDNFSTSLPVSVNLVVYSKTGDEPGPSIPDLGGNEETDDLTAENKTRYVPFENSISISKSKEIEIRFMAGADSPESLILYDRNGDEIKIFEIGKSRTGVQSVFWQGLNSTGEKVASGIYNLVLKTNLDTLIQKIAVLK